MTIDSQMKYIAEQSNSWPFVEAKKLRDRITKLNPSIGDINEKPVLFETGYGPSGLPHIGTFGEVARTAMVQNAFNYLTGKKTKLICFSDDMDGFRKVPENVPNKLMLEKYIDKPLTSVPDPFEKYESFGSHNNARLIEFLDKFNFDYEFVSSTEYYKSGKFDFALKKVLIHYDKIIKIILPTLGQERQSNYSPFLPLCPKTGKVLQVKVIETNVEDQTITYLSEGSNELITVSILRGNCKLQWKCDWAMRWYALGVDYEMSGKDLSESVILSSKILNILGGVPPTGFSYELFLDGNGEKISKSKGNGLSIEEWLRYGTQESLSLFMYSNPKRAKRLFFDVIPKSIDEYFSHLKNYHTQEEMKKMDNPCWHIHNGKPLREVFPVSFNLLLNLASVCHAKNENILWEYISNYVPEINKGENSEFDELVKLALNFFNERVLPNKKYRKPNEIEKKGIKILIDFLENSKDDISSEEIQNKIFSIGKELKYENLKDWFLGLYETVLGQSNGPRMGGFIKLFGIKSTISLLNEVLEGSLIFKVKR